MDIANYRWSSLRAYASAKAPAWLSGDGLLAASGLNSGKAGWRAYCTRLGILMGDKQAREQLSAKHLSRGWCIGSKEFRKTMQESLKEQLAEWRERHFAGLEPDELKVERTLLWEESLQAYARELKINLAKLGPKKSAPEKVRLAAAMKSGTSVSNGWLAQRLAMGEPASVSQFVRRWLIVPKQKRETEAVLSKVKV